MILIEGLVEFRKGGRGQSNKFLDILLLLLLFVTCNLCLGADCQLCVCLHVCLTGESRMWVYLIIIIMF